VREVVVLIKEYWENVFAFLTSPFTAGGSGLKNALLFDLAVDPYEDNDVSAANRDVVEMLEARVAKMETHFPKNCDWFVMDTKVEFETVEYVDEDGATVSKQYHGAWVPDEEYDAYSPTLVNVGPARKYGAAGIMTLEALVLLYALRTVTKLFI